MLFLLFLAYAGLEVILTWKAWVFLPFWKFLLIFAGTGLVGLSMLKNEALKSFRQGLGRARSAHDVSAAMFDGLLVGVSGILLILPGIVGDVIGLILMVSPLRRFLARRLAASGKFQTQAFGRGPVRGGQAAAPSRPRPDDDGVIEVEGREIHTEAAPLPESQAAGERR